MYQFKPDGYSSHSKIIRAVGKNKKVLDVGCASGYLAEKMKLNGCQVIGIDMDRNALKEAKKFCKKTIYGDISKMNINKKIKQKFDVIVLGDIIEHVPNPEEILLKVKKSLNENGFLVISTGNIANIYIRLHLLFGDFNYQEKGLLDKTHLRFFTYKTLRNLIKKTGYKIENIDLSLIPLELRFPNIPKPLLQLFRFLLLLATKIVPGLFAYQFIVKAKVSKI